MIDLHPLCTLFPRMTGAEFDALVADIKANGQRETIITHDGMILDGGNRYRACLAAGVEPKTMAFVGGNIVSYVLSANLHRRHMTAGQQAAIVASAQDWAQAQVVGGDRKSEQAKIKVQDCTLKTAEDRAAQSGASLRTQKDADKVAKASPELARQVAHGEKSLPKAVEELTGKRPGAKPPKPPKPEPVADEESGDLDALRFEIDQLKAENENLKIWGDDNAKTAKDLIDDNNSMAAVFESSDQLAAAISEAKKFREMNRVLEERIRGLMNEKNELIRAAKMWKAKYEKAVKAQ